MTKDTQDMPEEIWVWGEDAMENHRGWREKPHSLSTSETRYIRADLATPAPSMDREKALDEVEGLIFNGLGMTTTTYKTIKAALQSPRPRDDASDVLNDLYHHTDLTSGQREMIEEYFDTAPKAEGEV